MSHISHRLSQFTLVLNTEQEGPLSLIQIAIYISSQVLEDFKWQQFKLKSIKRLQSYKMYKI